MRVSGSQDWKSLKGVREGLSLRFTIVPTEVDFNENRAVIYCSIFPRSLDGLQATLDRWNINYIKLNLKMPLGKSEEIVSLSLMLLFDVKLHK